MQTVTSKDGSTIAYDKQGSGPKVILVGGALSYRKFPKMEELATKLAAAGIEVINYDRRGRGDSTEATPFAHETAAAREVEDIAAIIGAEGGKASLWGWSSGGALALRAAAALDVVERVSVYEIPFIVDPGHKYPTPDYSDRLDELVAAGDRSGAVKHFMRNAMGMPAPFVFAMRLMPMWKGLASTAHTLPYDWEALGGHTMYGAPLSVEEFAAVGVPVQVVAGDKSAKVLRQSSKALARILPDAEHTELAGVGHNVKIDALVPVIAPFLTGERGRAGRAAATLATV
jgi:pimeloyl-ACP methyl ester carboxylesterase